ncbi:Short-chain dehydrogenase TIC 32, chloroplastic [Turnera subulata]|uniref:Short-chain dehydrogenase TIC 32, chloroplastic n=1 Tax=Turnera subulata TaxID=218843 RepID=A0A9Q0J6Z7_9ROSI|nr:Short-chain dehydrogenase TIC 32, chloroplastic [Turnera subulata]
MWVFGRKGPSGFSSSSTAEQVTQGIDGTGLTAIVTGASSGIGVETTRVLALRGVHVVMAVRNVEAGGKVKESILKEIPTAKIDVMQLDLSSLASVRKFASGYISSGLPLNLLIISALSAYFLLLFETVSTNILFFCVVSNNAGIMAAPFQLSEDNIELQFATNHIGHFLLTNLLLDKMKHTALETNKEGRIVILSSEAHRFTYREGIRFDKINNESEYSTMRAYGQSKLANVLHANELTRRLKVLNDTSKLSLNYAMQDDGVNITANSLHPGAINTNLLRYHSIINGIATTLGRLVLKNVQQGAATTCYVALHPQVQGVSGEYFSDSNIAKASAQAHDEQLAKKLWDFSLGLTNPK